MMQDIRERGRQMFDHAAAVTRSLKTDREKMLVIRDETIAVLKLYIENGIVTDPVDGEIKAIARARKTIRRLEYLNHCERTALAAIAALRRKSRKPAA